MPHGRPTTATVAAATTVVAGRLSSISLLKMPCRISAGYFFDTSLSAGAMFGNDGQSARYAAFDVGLIPVFCHSLASPAPAFSYITQPFHLPGGCCPPLFLRSLPALRCGLPAVRLEVSAARAPYLVTFRFSRRRWNTSGTCGSFIHSGLLCRWCWDCWPRAGTWPGMNPVRSESRNFT